jgi:hypothetical protein
MGGASPHPRQLAHVREDADAGDGFMYEEGGDAPLPGEEVRFPGPGRGREAVRVLHRDARLVPQTEDLELIYDPILNCYWDPTNNKYYELKND